jgi:hypothetical protein
MTEAMDNSAVQIKWGLGGLKDGICVQVNPSPSAPVEVAGVDTLTIYLKYGN